jgi:TolB-like protein
MIFRFEDCELDCDLHELRRNGRAIAVEPQVFDVLVHLVRNRDRLVSKDELFDVVWKGRIVSDSTLLSRVKAARRAIGDSGKTQTLIRTLPRRGFRFIGDVASATAASIAGESARFGEEGGAPAVPAGDRPTIAVLPLDNMSDDRELAYIADGIAEDIITGLSKSRMFFVISRNSTFSYKGMSVDTKRVASELGVQYVVEGSVRNIGNRIRITAQLIDASADKHVWAEQYDREVSEAPEIQDEIIRSIVASIARELVSAEIYRVRREEPRTLDAWDHYVRTYWHLSRFSEADFAEARRISAEAIDVNPSGSGQHGLLATVHVIEALYDWGTSWTDSMRRARQAAERAVALDDHDPRALRALGLVDLYERRHADALHNFQRAIDLDPLEAENHALFGNTLAFAGDYEAAREHVDYAIRLSPRDTFLATWYNNLGMGAVGAGRNEDALEWARLTIRHNPQFPGGYRTLAAASGHLGRDQDAQSAIEKLLELLPELTIAKVGEKLPFTLGEPLDRYLDGLRKAGLPE